MRINDDDDDDGDDREKRQHDVITAQELAHGRRRHQVHGVHVPHLFWPVRMVQGTRVQGVQRLGQYCRP